MKIAILECRSDRFISDVVSRLSDKTVEFPSFQELSIPVVSDYRVVVDRVSYMNPFLREILKTLSLSGAYVINNPFVATTGNKILDIELCARLGIAAPKTMVLPCLAGSEELEGMIQQPSWQRIQDEIGFPCVFKPFDGYAWQDVYVVNTLEELQQQYHSLMNTRLFIVQQLIKYRSYYRFFCINKHEVLPVRWIPKPLGMGEYLLGQLDDLQGVEEKLFQWTIALNSALGWDFNAVEWCLDDAGQPWMIDCFNDVPEIRSESLPSEYYGWIVDRFAQCIRDKFDSQQTNRHLFLTP